MRQRPKKKPQIRKKSPLKRPLQPFKNIAGNIKRVLRVFPEPPTGFFKPPAPIAPAPPTDDRVPSHYGDNKLVLLVRDPWWLFAYWEIEDGHHQEIARQIARDGHKNRKTVLRVFDVTGAGLPKFNSFFDIELNVYSDNWYIDVGVPDREWMAEIGYRTNEGLFYVLARSNRVRTPAFGISDVLDEEWMLPEDIYCRIIGLTLGLGSQGGSMDIRKLLERYMRGVISSESAPNVKPGRAEAAGPASGLLE
jgi:hypothetical protein